MILKPFFADDLIPYAYIRTTHWNEKTPQSTLRNYWPLPPKGEPARLTVSGSIRANPYTGRERIGLRVCWSLR